MDNSEHDPEPSASAAAPRASWGPDRRLRWISLLAAIAAIAWSLADSDAEDRLVAGVLAVLLLIVTVVFVRVRVRLTADTTGIAVCGPLRRQFATWADVTSITAPQRGRFGRRAASLEVEYVTGSDTDPQLWAFGSLELGADPAEVARALRRLRPEPR